MGDLRMQRGWGWALVPLALGILVLSATILSRSQAPQHQGNFPGGIPAAPTYPGPGSVLGSPSPAPDFEGQGETARPDLGPGRDHGEGISVPAPAPSLRCRAITTHAVEDACLRIALRAGDDYLSLDRCTLEWAERAAYRLRLEEAEQDERLAP